MADLTPALVAVASIVGGLLALSRNLPRVRKLFRVDQAELVSNLRELADTWEEKHRLVTTDLAAAKAAHAAAIEDLRLERDAGFRCRRELDTVQSELRAINRRRVRGGPG